MKIFNVCFVLLLTLLFGCSYVIKTITKEFEIVSIDDTFYTPRYSDTSYKDGYKIIFKYDKYTYYENIPLCNDFDKTKIIGLKFWFDIELTSEGDKNISYNYYNNKETKDKKLKDYLLEKACL